MTAPLLPRVHSPPATPGSTALHATWHLPTDSACDV